MREQTETIRTYYNADPRKEWDALRFCEKREYLTHTEHLMIVSKKDW